MPTPGLRRQIIHFLIFKSAELEFSVITTESIPVDLSGFWMKALGLLWGWEDWEEMNKNTNEDNRALCAIIPVEIKCNKNVREKF